MNKSEKLDKLAPALCKAQAALSGGVAKTGENKFHSFNYVELPEIVGTLRGVLGEHGLSIVSSVTRVELRPGLLPPDKQGFEVVVVEVDITSLLLHDSGQWIEFVASGHGANKEKAIFSAQTGARKYGLQAAFGLGGGPEEDPDHSANDPAAAAGRKTEGGGRQTTTNAREKAKAREPAAAPNPIMGTDGRPLWLDDSMWGKKWGDKGDNPHTWREMIAAGAGSDQEGYIHWMATNSKYRASEPVKKRASYVLKLICQDFNAPPIDERASDWTPNPADVDQSTTGIGDGPENQDQGYGDGLTSGPGAGGDSGAPDPANDFGIDGDGNPVF